MDDTRNRTGLRGENGQSLVMALLALTLATLLVTGFLVYAATSQRAIKATNEQAIDHYSADAGVEHALWRLQNEPSFAQTVLDNSPFTYTITINDKLVIITVTRILTP